MKRIFATIFVLMACNVFAQSPTAFRNINLIGVLGYDPPNAWYGSTLTYPFTGTDFDLAFGVKLETVLSFTEFNLGRHWSVLAFGDLGLPNYNSVNAFTGVESSQEGIDVGVQAFTVVGDLRENALTVYLTSKAKLNSFASTSINSYHFGPGFEMSARGGGLPLVVNISPTYVLLANKTRFASVQNETAGVGFWKAESFVIIPVGDKLGLLTEVTFAEFVKPQVRVGLILSAGL